MSLLPGASAASLIKKAVITGGNGFVGSSLVARLVKMGVEVHALANENHQKLDALLPPNQIHELLTGAQSAAEVVLKVEPDSIFHLAAVYAEPTSVDSALSMIQGNFTLGTCLLHASTEIANRPVFVNTGTYWQFDEQGKYEPNTLYAATKQAFQDILVFYHRRMGVRSTSLALYDTFGPQDDRGKLWQKLTTSPTGSKISLSSGVQRLQLVHIDDVIDAFIHATQLLRTNSEVEEIYAVRGEEFLTLRDFVEEYNRRTGNGLTLGWGEHPAWEGQIFSPWRGNCLPGWTPALDPMNALLSMTMRDDKHKEDVR